MFTPERKFAAKATYCTVLCQRRAHCSPEYNASIAKDTAAWRGDSLRWSGKGRGYVKFNGRHLHRVLAEQLLGRLLLPGEIVHHKDGNKRNNMPGNLEILPSQSAHAKAHGFGLKGGVNSARQ